MSRSRPYLERDVVPSIEAVCTLMMAGFRQTGALPSGQKSPPQPEEDFTWPGVQSNRERRKQHPKGWPVHQESSTPTALKYGYAAIPFQDDRHYGAGPYRDKWSCC